VPLLPLEPFVFPGDLFQREPPAGGEPWWVLHTRPRAEKVLARRLLQRQTPFFLPLCKRQWRNRGRAHCSYVPLFPGYVFQQSERPTFTGTAEGHCVARILQVEDQGQLQADLRRVYCLIASDAAMTPESRLQPGTEVEITSGPLAGLDGRILRRGKQLRFFVEVRFLQQGVSVEIDSWMIEPRNPLPKLEPAWS
jgi:transcriptional antiterminator RfaH